MAEKRHHFWTNRRNVIAFALWLALVFALVVGVAVNASLFLEEKVGDTEIYRRLRYALLSFALMSVPFLLEQFLHFRFPLFLEFLLPLFTFSLFAIGIVFGVYERHPAYGDALYAAGGILFILLGLSFCDVLLRPIPLSGRKIAVAALISLLFCLAVGFLWIASDLAFGGAYGVRPDQSSLSLHILLLLSCGGGAALLCLVFLLRRPERFRLFAIERTPRKK